MATKSNIISTLFVLLFLNFKGFSNPFILLDSVNLAQVKQLLQDNTAPEETKHAYLKLLKRADKFLTIENPTVMDKSIFPPTQDKHDYLSISRYWWPNPNSPDGLPWIRKDGETNPDTQTDAVDRKRLGVMSESVKTLSLAYYFSENEKYAKKATSIIKTWFIDKKTRMNPHLEYAQSIPGNPKGRSSGILDGRSIAKVIPDAMSIISKSSHWKKDYELYMKNWLTEYLTWLTESDLGKKGSEQKNNHGSWYKFQVGALALYLGNKHLVKKIVVATQESLNEQLNNEGGQIHELQRTKSFFYSCFNLDALIYVAIIGDKIGLNMWQYESTEKKSLSLAINYLTPVVNGEKWQHSNNYGTDISRLVSILTLMSQYTGSEEYSSLLTKVIQKMNENKTSNSKNNILDELLLLGNISF